MNTHEAVKLLKSLGYVVHKKGQDTFALWEKNEGAIYTARELVRYARGYHRRHLGKEFNCAKLHSYRPNCPCCQPAMTVKAKQNRFIRRKAKYFLSLEAND